LIIMHHAKFVGLGLFLVTACSSAAQQSTPQPAPTDVVATVGSSSITLAEVDERALQQPASDFGSVKLSQALYNARRAAVDEIVANRLFDEAAKAQRIERTALIEKEITGKIKDVTEAEIAEWYRANQNRVQGATLDQVRAPIRTYLTQERMQAIRTEYLNTLKAKTAVRINLEPPRQRVATADSPARGPANAPIELVEFSDFQCPYCLRADPTVRQVLATYGDRIRFVYRHYPLPNHPNARPAAEAAACAGDQGKFWAYHDRLFTNQTRLTDADLKQHAVEIGIDTAKFNACLDGHATKARVDADMRAGEEAGVNGTPAFFINGRSLSGAQPYEAFKRIIDEELEFKKSSR
jgi:protein-disulfide isomerase